MPNALLCALSIKFTLIGLDCSCVGSAPVARAVREKGVLVTSHDQVCSDGC
jgi:hypothetical protein